MATKGKSEYVIEHIGCGRFQVIQYVCVAIVSYVCPTFTNQFMSFGNYNPGWRCLDPHNDTIHGDNMTTPMDGKPGFGMTYQAKSVISNNVTSQEYSLGDCSVFESCKNVEFNPEASTIVTEWGLVCDKAWIPSFILSLQMVGLMIGACFAGAAADAFGRKWVLYISLFCCMVLNILSLFSNSWQMFAALRFIIGLPTSIYIALYYIYLAEFQPIKWRAIVIGWPCYPVCGVIFGVTCLLFKDWRHVHIVAIVSGVFGLVPAFWLPESMRWLQVKNKMTKFQNTAQQIANLNGNDLPPLEQLNVDIKLETNKQNISDIIRNIRQLFGKEYRKSTLFTSLPWFSVSLVYTAIGFGVKAMGGNFYMNLILIYGIEVIIDNLLMFAPNLLGRKKAGIIFLVVSGICLLIAACFQELVGGSTKIYGVAFLAMFARISVSAFWNVMKIFMVEIYPTVARGAASSWGLLVARVGGIVAPLLIPNEASTVYICYTVMGVLAIAVSINVLILPETRGKALKDTFEDNIDIKNDVQDDNARVQP